MKLGVDFPESWREKSKTDDISLSDLLYGYIVEDLMCRVCASSFKEHLWLCNESVLGESVYRKASKESLEFFYMENKKTFAKSSIEAGDALDAKVLELLLKEVFSKESFHQGEETSWTYQYEEKDNQIFVKLNATYIQMQVPVTMYIKPVVLSSQKPKKRELISLFQQRRVCEYYSYSKESILTESLFEIIHKMELISDMEHYDVVNEILKEQSLSGRYILEDLKAMAAKSPKMISVKRLEQIASYKNYGYMKKKWQQYCRQQKREMTTWEELMDRLMNFLSPLWKALCEDEIFFDDWMPELGRFLG